MRAPKILFLLTDGARARFVEQSAQTGDFATLSEVDRRDRLETLRAELRASAPGRSVQSGTPERHSVGREGAFRQAKEAFVAEMADRAAEVCRERDFQAVFIAAPARLVGPLRRHLETQAKIAGALQKDLTKAPDAALGRWLNHPVAV
ncbi:MAG: host attachment protein [Phenylobacterium sp.]